MIAIILLTIWITIGTYAMFMNMERCGRIYGSPEFDTQAACSFLLGPIGLFLVAESGGRWLFWRKQ